MSIAEMKWEIVRKLDQMSDSAVKEVLNLINQVEKKPEIRYDILSELDTVMEEDKNLLDRLSK